MTSNSVKELFGVFAVSDLLHSEPTDPVAHDNQQVILVVSGRHSVEPERAHLIDRASKEPVIHLIFGTVSTQTVDQAVFIGNRLSNLNLLAIDFPVAPKLNTRPDKQHWRQAERQRSRNAKPKR